MDTELFPVTVEMPSGRHRIARVSIRDGVARVFVARGRRIELAGEALVASLDVSKRRSQPSVLVTEDGQTWNVTKLASCGCGNPLKRFDPAKWTSTS